MSAISKDRRTANGHDVQELVVDAWGVDDTPVRELFQPLIDWTNHAVPGLKNKYPSTWNEKRYLRRVVREILIAVSQVDLEAARSMSILIAAGFPGSAL